VDIFYDAVRRFPLPSRRDIEREKVNFRSSFIEQIDKLYDKGIVDIPTMIERDGKLEDVKVSVNMNKNQVEDYIENLKKN